MLRANLRARSQGAKRVTWTRRTSSAPFVSFELQIELQ
jgi:hypothetical protein